MEEDLTRMETQKRQAEARFGLGSSKLDGITKDPNTEQFLLAVRNIVKHAKRSLLDMVDFTKGHRLKARDEDPLTHDALELVSKRIHNDVSMIESQIVSAFSIYQNGGVIPAFGRREEEMSGRKPDAHR